MEQPQIVDRPNTHYTQRGSMPDGIILHAMGQYIAGEFAADFLERIGLSAHWLIGPGGVIYRCVDPDLQAYHAGKSKLGEQENLNTTFIGIELLVGGDHNYESFLETIKKPETFTEQHYASLGWLLEDQRGRFEIPKNRIVRHSDVSGIDVRPDPKQDPGQGFDYERVLDTLNENQHENTA